LKAGPRRNGRADDTTFSYLEGRRRSTRQRISEAVERWKQLHSDENAKFDMTVELQAEQIAPQVTWGTNPGMVTSVNARVPDPHDFKDPNDQKATESALKYMGLKPAHRLRTSASTASSSAPAPIRASTIFAPPASRRRKTRREIHQAGAHVPGSRGIKAAAEKKASTRFHRSRI